MVLKDQNGATAGSQMVETRIVLRILCGRSCLESFQSLFSSPRQKCVEGNGVNFPNLCCLKVSPLGLAGESKFGSLSAEYYMKESRLQLSVLGHFWLVGQFTNSRDDWL